MSVETEVERLIHREHHDPHSLLGLHPNGEGMVVRAYRPTAEKVIARDERGESIELTESHPAGLFEGTFAEADADAPRATSSRSPTPTAAGTRSATPTPSRRRSATSTCT